ncbi:MAG: hypothetical protein LBL58_02035 [Tannerellaceae bacterium]|nr:hypothetical protein [Tannerellaceae bacterium]
MTRHPALNGLHHNHKENYDRIKSEVKQIVEIEIQRIKDDPDLCHLLPKEE